MAIDPPGPQAGCVAKLTSTGGPDTASWYEAWGELSAILSMCFRRAGVLGSSSFGKISEVTLGRSLTDFFQVDLPVSGWRCFNHDPQSCR